MNLISRVLLLVLPLILSGFIHMAVVRTNFLAGLKMPIHEGWFGVNKTWRGFVVMPLATALTAGLVAAIWHDAFAGYNPFILGMVVGLAYVIAELPNSFVKRRIGVEPGKRPSRHTVLFAFVDQADSAVGCAVVYWILLHLPLVIVLLIIILGPAIHLIANYTLYLMRLRKEPV